MDRRIEELLAIVSNKVTSCQSNIYEHIFINTIVVRSEIANYKLHGITTISFIGGGKKREITCEYINGLRHGNYSERYGNRFTTCTYFNNMLNGRYVKTRKNIILKSCSYSHGKKGGIYIRNFRDGSNKVTCYYNNGKLHGKYIKNYSNGGCYIKCRYDNGMKYGEYIQLYDNGFVSVYCSNYIKNKKNGIYATFNKDGKLETYTIISMK